MPNARGMVIIAREEWWMEGMQAAAPTDTEARDALERHLHNSIGGMELFSRVPGRHFISCTRETEACRQQQAQIGVATCCMSCHRHRVRKSTKHQFSICFSSDQAGSSALELQTTTNLSTTITYCPSMRLSLSSSQKYPHTEHDQHPLTCCTTV